MKKRRFNFLILAFTIVLIFTFSDVSALFAQTAADEEFTLEEITVTAMKRAENQQKVPIAMEVISAAEIRELGKNDIDEILSGISNAIIEKAQDGYRITVRGVTDNSEAYHGMSMAPPAVAINTDGVYSNRKDTGGGLFDIERVEVLYGPQSTMYSSNSPGGIVNVITAQPKTDKFEVSGSIEAGNYELLHTEGAVNVPLSDKVAMRASFSTNVRGAYLTSGSDNEDTKSMRLRTLIQPNDKLSFTVTGEMSKNQGSGFGGGVVAFAYQDDKYYPDGTKLTDPWTGVETDNKSSNDQTARKISGQINWDTGIGTLVMTPSYSTRQGSSEEVRGAMPGGGGAPPPPMSFGGGGFLVPAQGTGGTEESVTFMKQRAREKGLEVRMTSASDFFFKWILGGTYYLAKDGQRMDSEEYITTGTGSWSNRLNTNKNRALFANITYPIVDRFRVTAGYRKSWDTMISDNEEVRGALPGGDVPPGTLEYSLEHSEMSTAGSPDYKLGFEFDLGTNSMVYADYSTSYRVQGMGGRGGTQEPEKLKAYTLGAKNRFFDNKLQLNGSVYYYDYRNYRAGGNDVMAWLWDYTENVIGTPPNLIMENGEYFREPYANGTGDGRMIGVDLSSSIVITPKDMVNLSVSYIKSEWTDLSMTYKYTYTLVYVESDAEKPYPHTDIVPQLGANYNGKSMMSSPPWNINLTYDHTFSLWNGGTIRASINTKYKSEFSLSWRESDYPMNFQESYFMEDVNVVYNNPDGVWNLSTYVKNITNYAEKRMIMNAGGGKLLSIGNPRTYGAVLSVKF